MDEEQRAKLLADWLNSPAGTPPPDGLDDETLSAVYALSPGRAPSPRVSEADILAQVTEGPFATAAPTTGQVVGFPVPVKKAAPARRTRPSPLWWAFPGIGVAMAAAAAVAILIPALNGGSVQEQMYEATRSNPAPAAPPPPPVTSLPEMAPPVAPLAANTPSRERADGNAAPTPATAPIAPAVSGGASVVADAPGPAPVGGLSAPPPPTDLGVDRAYAEKASTKDDRTIAEEELAGAGEDYRRFENDDADASPPAPATTAASDREEQKKTAKTTRSASAPTEDTLARAPRKTSAPGAPPAAAEPMAQGTFGDVATGSSAMESRAAATPLDYDPGWFRKYADIVPTYQEAAAREAARDWAAAVTLYKPLVADPRSDLAQDAAWRGARALWAQGKSSEAMAMVTAGLKRSTEGTVFRVHLLVLQGDLLNAMARPVDAVRAWDEAADQNRER